MATVYNITSLSANEIRAQKKIALAKKYTKRIAAVSAGVAIASIAVIVACGSNDKNDD